MRDLKRSKVWRDLKVMDKDKSFTKNTEQLKARLSNSDVVESRAVATTANFSHLNEDIELVGIAELISTDRWLCD